MAYCTKSDVEALEAGRKIVFYDAPVSPATTPVATIPTATQVGTFINMIYDEINAAILEAGYQIPTTTNNYLLMTNALGAAWLVELAFNTSASTEGSKTTNDRQSAYQSRLAAIKANPRGLAGAVPGDAGVNNLAVSDGTTCFVNQDPNIKYHANGRDW